MNKLQGIEMNYLENLKELKKSMEYNGWMICSFLFKYKSIDYIVLVKRYSSNEIKPQYALVKLHFMQYRNLNNELETPANSTKLMIDTKLLRSYFGIEYSENIGDLLSQFKKYLGTFIPTKIKDTNYSDIEKTAIVRSLSQSDSEDPNKIYCYKVKRNPLKSDGTRSLRSPFNSDKTKILRPDLYEKLKEEKHLSFCYSDNPTQEKTDQEIIYNWTKQENR